MDRPTAVLIPALLTALVLLWSCAPSHNDFPGLVSRVPEVFPDSGDETLAEINYDAADELEDGLYYYLPDDSPVYVEPFTNMETPGETSTFGRIVAEQLAGWLSQDGFHMIKGSPPPELVHSLRTPPPFETNGTAGKPSPPPGVLTGTYTVGKSLVYLSAKVTMLKDNAQVSGYDWTVPLDINTRRLLKKKPDPLRPSVQTMPTTETTAPSPGNRGPFPAPARPGPMNDAEIFE